MPAVKRPIRGSRGFYPRKRAKRIYPRIKSWPALAVNAAAPAGFAGYKAGMSHVLVTDTNPRTKTKGQLIAKAVSVVECPALQVFGFRCYQQTPSGLTCVQDVFSDKLDKNLSKKFKLIPKPITFDASKKFLKVHLLCHTKPPFKKKPEVFEIALSGTAEQQIEYAKQSLGKELKAGEIFKTGDYVDVSAVTRGFGFEGPVKRFGVKIHGRKARQMHRHVGTLGPRHPARIQTTVPMAGQKGFQSRTEFNKRVLKIAQPQEVNVKGGFPNYGVVKNECLLIEGSVPGSKKRLIRLRLPIRPPKSRFPIEIKYVSQESKQGV